MSLGAKLGRVLRHGVLGLLSALRRDLSYEEVERRYDTLSPMARFGVSASVMFALFAVSMIFAQGGLLGMGIFFGLVFLLIR